MERLHIRRHPLQRRPAQASSSHDQQPSAGITHDKIPHARYPDRKRFAFSPSSGSLPVEDSCCEDEKGQFEKGLARRDHVLSVERSTDDCTVGVVIELAARGLYGVQGWVVDEIGELGVFFLYVVRYWINDKVVGRRGHTDTKVIP